MIDMLPLAIISVAIEKRLMNDYLPHWDIFHTAWTFLTERFDKHIEKNHDSENGVIIVDTSTNMDERKTRQIINDLIKYGSNMQSITRVKDESYFFPSESQQVIQIADAASYCTLKKLNRCDKFFKYWVKITNKDLYFAHFAYLCSIV